jgi:hypothetical protein
MVLQPASRRPWRAAPPRSSTPEEKRVVAHKPQHDQKAPFVFRQREGSHVVEQHHASLSFQLPRRGATTTGTRSPSPASRLTNSHGVTATERYTNDMSARRHE